MRTLKAIYMNNKTLLRDPSYSPDAMLDTIITEFGLKNDAGLARALRVQAPIISKIRNRKAPVSDTLLIRFHEASGKPIAELRDLMGAKPHIQPLTKA